MDSFDVVVVGGGAAGLSSAIYAGRKKLKTLVVVGPHPGGETMLTNDIRNYPGYEGAGSGLMKVFEQQARLWGAVFVDDLVERVSKSKGVFTIRLVSGKSVLSRSVILSFGRVRRKLGILGEEEWMGRGVSTCTTCDAPLFNGKTVAVIGGGNAAVEGALDAAAYASKVYLVHRRDDFRADDVTVEKARKNSKIEFVTPFCPVAISGQKLVSGLRVKDVSSGKIRDLAVHGVFIEIGYETDTRMVDGLVDTTKSGEIVVDIACRTKTQGVFAAGDLTCVPFKQTVISAGMGAVAALECHKFLSGGSGGE